MKYNKKKSYSCVLCGKITKTLHECFYGSANRKISIKYNMQVPLCNDCHIEAHKDKELWQMYLCQKLRINYSITKRMINNFTDNKAYFEGIKDKCLEKLKSWEI